MKTMIRWVAVVAAVVVLGLNTDSASSQSLGVKASGMKKFLLSDKVGKNQFKWLSDAPGEKINGTSEGVSGWINLDPKKLSTISGFISTQVATMQTGKAMMDEHLKGPMWLDAAKYGAITFKPTKLVGVKTKGNIMTAIVLGDFTMHGVTKQISVPFTFTYMDASPKSAERAAGDLAVITGHFQIALKDFKVAGKEGVIGKSVGETIVIDATLFGNAG